MVVDFSEPMSIYELIAIIISIIAILTPVIKWIWNEWVVKPKLKHLPTGNIFLFINRSGSYVQIDGVFEAKNKPINIRNVTVKIIRRKDDRKLNLEWLSFHSPVNQQIVGNYASTIEQAHTFRIEANSMICAFIEFCVLDNISWKKIMPFYNELFLAVRAMWEKNMPYEASLSEFIKSDSYKNTKNILEKECFWDIGSYKVIMDVEYDKKKTQFVYFFEVNLDEYKLIKYNIEETLRLSLKDCYRMPYAYELVRVKLKK